MQAGRIRLCKPKLVSYRSLDPKRPVWADSKLWEDLVGSGSGVYFYRPLKSVVYPFGDSRIVYIGKADKLAERFLRHFREDMKTKLVEGEDTLAWFYQNYFAKGIPTDISIVSCSHPEVVERLFIGLFAVRFGAAPLCNSSIQRTKFRETYQAYRALPLVEEIAEVIEKLSK